MNTPDPLLPIHDALQSIYDSDTEMLEGQRTRYGQALRSFYAQFGPGPVMVARAPGRVSLIGEHTDYNHGFVLPMALDKDTLVFGRRRRDRHMRLYNVESDRFPVQEFDLSDNIPPAPLGDWGNYVRAAAQALFVQNSALMGMDALVSGGAPWGTPRAAGLSSSSALLVVAALTFCTLNQISLPKEDFARLCSEAEWYVGTRGGIMDQFISVLGQRGHALLLDCRPHMDEQTDHAVYHVESVRIPDGYRVIICNSGVQREKTRSLYNVRVAECRLAVALLKQRYPHITHLRDISAEGLSLSQDEVMAIVESLPESLSMANVARQPALGETLRTLNAQLPADQVFMVRARARHVVSENARVLAGAQALRSGDAAAFGRMMNAAHESMSRDYDASCREVDVLADIARSAPGVLGARITGAGWGGCVVALALDQDLGFKRQVAATYTKATGLTTGVFVCRSGPGASVVGEVAV